MSFIDEKISNNSKSNKISLSPLAIALLAGVISSVFLPIFLPFPLTARVFFLHWILWLLLPCSFVQNSNFKNVTKLNKHRFHVRWTSSRSGAAATISGGGGARAHTPGLWRKENSISDRMGHKKKCEMRKGGRKVSDFWLLIYKSSHRAPIMRLKRSEKR